MRRIVVRRVIGWALLLMGLGTVITGLGDRSEATTDYARSATTIDIVVGVALLAWGVRLAFRRPKRDQAAAERGQDQQGST